MFVRIVLAIVSCAAFACGEDTKGDLPFPVVRTWQAGTNIGYAVVSYQTRSATDLDAPRCGTDFQFAIVEETGGLPAIEESGSCVLTNAHGWQDAIGITPACAGNVRVSYGDESQTFSYCSSRFIGVTEFDCEQLDGSTGFTIQSAAGENADDVVGELNLRSLRPTVPTITEPALFRDGLADWPTGELVVGWEATGAPGVEIVLGSNIEEGGVRLRCVVPDSGSFTLPDALVERFRDANASLEVATVYRVLGAAGDFSMRASFRVSDSIWLLLD